MVEAISFGSHVRGPQLDDINFLTFFLCALMLINRFALRRGGLPQDEGGQAPALHSKAPTLAAPRASSPAGHRARQFTRFQAHREKDSVPYRRDYPGRTSPPPTRAATRSAGAARC